MSLVKPLAALILLVVGGVLSQQAPLEEASAPPLLGFGTWNLKISHENTTAAVSAAIQIGYRHIDCAAIYGNEKEVGKGINEGIRKSGIKRSDVWVTSKLWNNAHDPQQVLQALEKTLKDLNVGYLDLYLMHWPVASKDGKIFIDFIDTWTAMTKLPTSLVRHIGVSNFSPDQLDDLIRKSHVKPFAHQFETHPYLQQSNWVLFHQHRGIHVTAYSPLGNLNPSYSHGKDVPSILDDEIISSVAKKRNCTNAQVALAWGLSRKTSVIPKSSHVSRIEENAGSVRCVLDEEDKVRIGGIQNRFVKRFNDPSKGWGVDLYDGLEGK